MSRWIRYLPLVVVLVLGLVPALADTREAAPRDVSPKAAKTTKGELPAFTQEREAAAMTFVRMHHAELADLLTRLKQHDRAEYEKAIRELFRASEKLAMQQEKQPQRYEAELKTWKLNSRIQVLMAKLSMGADPSVEKELRDTVTEQVEFRRQQLKLERDRMATKLADLDRELQQDMNTTIEQRLEQLVQGTNDRKKQRDAKKAAK